MYEFNDIEDYDDPFDYLEDEWYDFMDYMSDEYEVAEAFIKTLSIKDDTPSEPADFKRIVDEHKESITEAKNNKKFN